MLYLELENASKTYGDKVLFKDLNLQIHKGEKLALVAKNGTGKSTLLRVLSGAEKPEGENAKWSLRKDIRTSILTQEPEIDPNLTTMEAVFEADSPIIQAIKDYEFAMLHPEKSEKFEKALARMDDLKAWDFEAKIKEILSKLGIDNLEQKVGTLSGGQLKRLALAKILIEEPEFLILDEPTNHLDVDMIEWLEDYLRQPNLTLFMVTHDRYFLERVCNHIVELERGILYRYVGNYSDFLEKKTTRFETQSAELEKTKKLYKKELDWVRRSPQARTTKAKSRVNAFDDIKEKAHQKLDDSTLSIDFKTARLGSKIVEAQYISKAFGDKKIVDNFHYKFKKGERVGIVGPNGVGKSTFIRLLTGKERPDTGKVVIGETVVFGHYTQEGIQLEEDKRVIDVVRDVAEFIPMEKGQKLTAIQLLDRFLFSREQHQVYVSQLSGGERRRLFLLTILMTNPNFLILDEPTNDLDILTLNVLEDFLGDFPGCLIIVTHDRYFMDKLVDHLFIFHGKGQIKDFNGDYTDYRKWITEYEREQKRIEKAKADQNKAANEEAKPEVRKLSYQEKKEMSKLEKEMEKLEERKSSIYEQFNDPSLSSEQIEELSKEVGQIQKDLEDKEMRWMELAEYA
ncbi:MAG: ABC-F family ATP-binding cassette domain-containing protein [Saprospiraceae bacterium]|nr:ABC-F family ATP-binding cassette domain-containing protein [Saprospiraceae bacterium]